jgi:GT2 family glycosyltransferase
MQASVLIVSKNRKNELEKTLVVLSGMLDFSLHEVLVFLDGHTDDSLFLKDKYNWVKWYSSEISIGASAARHQLYPKAQGQFLIGLDDDAHPLHSDFIDRTRNIFDKYGNAGIIAFQEIKGIYNSDADALNKNKAEEEEYYCNEFIGCGFAIRKEVYEATNGFPVWVDIYGEESCVSIEVLALGFDIIYSNAIKVNHRVNLEERRKNGQNYFRFGRQLKNSTYYYLVYYPKPLLKIMKLYWHNFKKYALTDFESFKIFFKVIFEVWINFSKIWVYRNPVDNKKIKIIQKLPGLKF